MTPGYWDGKKIDPYILDSSMDSFANLANVQHEKINFPRIPTTRITEKNSCLAMSLDRLHQLGGNQLNTPIGIPVRKSARYFTGTRTVCYQHGFNDGGTKTQVV